MGRREPDPRVGWSFPIHVSTVGSEGEGARQLLLLMMLMLLMMLLCPRQMMVMLASGSSPTTPLSVVSTSPANGVRRSAGQVVLHRRSPGQVRTSSSTPSNPFNFEGEHFQNIFLL